MKAWNCYGAAVSKIACEVRETRSRVFNYVVGILKIDNAGCAKIDYGDITTIRNTEQFAVRIRGIKQCALLD